MMKTLSLEGDLNAVICFRVLDKICQVQKINYILADAEIRQNILN
jgi:hypothetical protein